LERNDCQPQVVTYRCECVLSLLVGSHRLRVPTGGLVGYPEEDEAFRLTWHITDMAIDVESRLELTSRRRSG
jgi:hypothetical protein